MENKYAVVERRSTRIKHRGFEPALPSAFSSSLVAPKLRGRFQVAFSGAGTTSRTLFVAAVLSFASQQ